NKLGSGTSEAAVRASEVNESYDALAHVIERLAGLQLMGVHDGGLTLRVALLRTSGEVSSIELTVDVHRESARVASLSMMPALAHLADLIDQPLSAAVQEARHRAECAIALRAEFQALLSRQTARTAIVAGDGGETTAL